MAPRAGHIATVADFGTVLYIEKTIDEPLASTTTLQNDDVLVLPMAANSKYRMFAYILYEGAADAGTGQGGLKMQFTGPSGASGKWTNFGVNTGALTTYNVVPEDLGAASPRSVGTNGATQMSCAPAGRFVTGSTAGSLQFKWAQNISNATSTIVKAGSWLELVKVA